MILGRTLLALLLLKIIFKLKSTSFMVNPESSAFKFSEKIGLIFGKGIRSIVIGGVVVFLGGKLGGFKPSQPAPNPPAPPTSP
jgi:hypothetical protein